MKTFWTDHPPKIIQGGMGVNISGWLLARTVSMLGQLGTVSGVALDRVVAYILQSGDPDGNIRRALANFPYPHIAQKVLEAFFNDDPSKIKRGVPVFTVKPSHLLISLTICANFALIYLAKEGHTNKVSVNYLTKVPMPLAYAITGAMLAKVDFITMGAGLATKIPQVLEDLSEGRATSYPIPIDGQKEPYLMEFNPTEFFGEKLALERPGFIPIISSNLAMHTLVKKTASGSIQAGINEKPRASGHNSPPRELLFDHNGEPIYGEKDKVNHDQLLSYGIPIYEAGASASPAILKWARSIGLAGIQVGHILAVSDESNMLEESKRLARYYGYLNQLKVKTDCRVSPTGFPFKVAQLAGTLGDKKVYEARTRVCDQKCLANPYERPDGTIGYRCSAEPIKDYVAKGGKIEDTIGRGCLCNGLLANCRIQTKDTYEPPIITLGPDSGFLKHLMNGPNDHYSAEQAIKYLLS